MYNQREGISNGVTKLPGRMMDGGLPWTEFLFSSRRPRATHPWPRPHSNGRNSAQLRPFSRKPLLVDFLNSAGEHEGRKRVGKSDSQILGPVLVLTPAPVPVPVLVLVPVPTLTLVLVLTLVS